MQLSSNIAVAAPVAEVSVAAVQLPSTYTVVLAGQVSVTVGSSSSSTVIVWVHVAVLSLPQASLAMAVNVRVIV